MSHRRNHRVSARPVDKRAWHAAGMLLRRLPFYSRLDAPPFDENGPPAALTPLGPSVSVETPIYNDGPIDRYPLSVDFMASQPPSNVHVVVLAAGKGTRMKTDRPKLLHRLGGLPLVEHVAAQRAFAQPRDDHVDRRLPGRRVLRRAARRRAGPRLRGPGTAARHRPRRAAGRCRCSAGRTGTLVLLYGDVPLLQAATLRRLVDHHAVLRRSRDPRHRPSSTARTATAASSASTGAIARHRRGARRDARATRDHRDQQRDLGVRPRRVVRRAARLGTEQRPGRVLPDGPRAAPIAAAGRGVETVVLDDATEVRGINSQSELAEMAAIVRTAQATTR